MVQKVPTLEQEIEDMKKKVAWAKRITKAFQVYKKFDPDSKNEVSTKNMIKEISGFAKFDKDFKITKNQFYFLLCSIAGDSDYPTETPNENSNDAFWEAANAIGQETPKFTGDLNNELFLKI